MGRPPEFTQEIADIICERIAEGESLRSICRDDDMPSCMSVFRWLDNRPDFVSKYARARVLQSETIADKAVDMIENVTPENAQAERVKLAAIQWIAAKLNPKKYGDKTTIESTGPDGGPIQSVGITTSDPVEAAKVYQRLIGEK